MIAVLAQDVAAGSGDLSNNILLVVLGVLQVPQILLGWAQWRQQQAERSQSHSHDMQRLAQEREVQQDSTAMGLVTQLMTRTGIEEMEERRRTNERLDGLTGEIGGFRSRVEDLTVAVQDMQIQATRMERDLNSFIRAGNSNRDPEPSKRLGARPSPPEPAPEPDS